MAGSQDVLDYIPIEVLEPFAAAMERLDRTEPDDAEAIRDYLNCLILGVDLARVEGHLEALEDVLGMYAETKERPTSGCWSGREVNHPRKEINMNQTTATEATTTEKCPRCSGPLRKFEEDQGALSRAADVTVCGRCGSDEAIRAHQTGRVVPVEEWPVDDAHKFAGPPPEIAKLLASIDSAPEGMMRILDPGEPFFETAVRRVHADSHLRDPQRVHKAVTDSSGEMFAFGDIYRFDGTKVAFADRPEGWWDRMREATENLAALDAAYRKNHGVARLADDYIFVGRGYWIATGETVVDGEPAVEFTEAHTYFREQQEALEAENLAFIEAHPQIEERRPAWAESVDAGPTQNRVVEVFFSQDFEVGGRVVAGKLDTRSGKFTLGPENFNVHDYRGDLAGLEKFAAELARMVETIKTEGA